MAVSSVVKFTYRRCGLGKRAEQLDITLAGNIGDHIFEQIRDTSSFYEADLLQRIDSLNLNHDLVVDVGANVGNHTVFFAKVLKARVVAIEPNPIALELLRQNILLNTVEDRVTIISAAASDTRNDVQLIAGPPSNLGINRVVEGGSNAEAVPVHADTVDAMISAIPGFATKRVSLIKIDVEGFEIRVLRGALGLLQRDRPPLVIEIEDEGNYFTVANMLKPLGYYPTGPFCATPTYVFLPNKRLMWYAWSVWKFRRLIQCV